MNEIVGASALSGLDGRVSQSEHTVRAARQERGAAGDASKEAPVDELVLSEEGLTAARFADEAAREEARRERRDAVAETTVTERRTRGDLVEDLAPEPPGTEARAMAAETLRELQREKAEAVRDLARTRPSLDGERAVRAYRENA